MYTPDVSEYVPEDPQEFIKMLLAGDIMPLRPRGSPEQLDAEQRLMQPGVYSGQRGAGSINQYGGRQSPYLDLLDILMFPTGKPAGR